MEKDSATRRKGVLYWAATRELSTGWAYQAGHLNRQKLQFFSQNKKLLMNILQIIGMRKGNLVESLNSV